MITPRVLRGMRDFLPEQMLLRRQIIETFREIFERHGFEPIETPVLEYYETIMGNMDDEKLVYHFEDQGGREIALRYDLTAPLARFVAQHQNELTFPFKRYHIAPVWRADRPQKGRYREFWQCDADIVGSASMTADADVVSIVVEALDAVNIPGFVVRVNHRKLLEAIARYAGVEGERAATVYRSIDKLDKIGPDGVTAELVENGVAAGTAERIVDFVALTGETDAILSRVGEELSGVEGAEEPVRELSDLFEFLAALGVPQDRYRLDLSLARGLGYYTGPVYEAWATDADIGSLCGAGRYDGLVGRFSKQDFPATGISLGIERIIDVVQEFGLMSVSRSVSEVLVTAFDRELVGASLQLTAMLRDEGLRAETYLDANRNLGRQLGYADQKGIPFAVIAGPDEIERNVAAVKDLRTQEQLEVPRGEVAAFIWGRMSNRS